MSVLTGNVVSGIFRAKHKTGFTFPVQLVGSAGTSGYIWADSTGAIRYGTTYPSDLDADGSTFASVSGANGSLSNVSSTAVPVDLLPGTDASFDLGSASYQWAELYANAVYLTSTCYITSSSATATLVGDLVLSEGYITVATTTDESCSIKRNSSAASSALFELETTAVDDTGTTLLIDNNCTGNGYALKIEHTGDYPAIDITGSATRTGNVITIAMANQLAQTALDITGAATGTSGEGIIHVDITGVCAGNPIRVDSTGANEATGQLLYLYSSGNQAAATNGICAYLSDAGAVQATSYNTYITSTANNGLAVVVAAAAATNVTLTGSSGQTAAMLYVDATTTNGWVGADNVGAVHIKGDGVQVAGANLLRVESSAANTALAALVEIAASGAFTNSTNGTCLAALDTGAAAGTSYAAYISSSANHGAAIVVAGAAKSNLVLTGPASQTASMLKVDGTSGAWIGATNVGMVHLASDGTLAHANASLLYIANSGASAAANLGSSLRINDTSTAGAGAYVGYITSTTNSLLALVQATTTTKTQLYVAPTASQTVSAIDIVSASVNASNIGTVSIVNTGVLAHANATNLYVYQNGNVAASTLGSCARFIDAAAAATSSYAVEITSAANNGLYVYLPTMADTTPATTRAIYGYVATATGSQTSGNLVGVRGEVNCTTSTNISGSYLYGVQGKLITNAATIDCGSGAVCGLYGQLDVTGGTLTSGYVTPIASNVYGANSGAFAAVDGIYVEHAGGGVINSLVRLFGKSTYVFDIASNTHDNVSTSGTCTTPGQAHGWIKVNIDGSTRYIALSEAVS